MRKHISHSSINSLWSCFVKTVLLMCIIDAAIYGCSFIAKFMSKKFSRNACIFMYFQKYHVRIICMSELYACQKYMYAWIMHFYACVIHNIYMSEIYVFQKYMRVRNICMPNVKNICILEVYMHVRYICILSRNICLLEVYWMDVRNICMYFQEHKTTKSGLQIFLVCVVWRYHGEIS